MDLNIAFNKYCDLFHDAIMIYYKKLKLNYLEGFIKVVNDLKDDFNPLTLEEDDINNLLNIYKEIDSITLEKKYLLMAIEYLLITGYKSLNYPLISFLPLPITNFMSAFVNELIKDKKNITILDISLKTFHLLSLINAKNKIGITNDELTIRLIEASSKIVLDEVMILNCSDQEINYQADVLIGDLTSPNINNRLANLSEDGFYLFIIKNEHILKSNIYQTINTIITLPNELTQEGVSLSIIYGMKALNNQEIKIISLKDLIKGDKNV